MRPTVAIAIALAHLSCAAPRQQTTKASTARIAPAATSVVAVEEPLVSGTGIVADSREPGASSPVAAAPAEVEWRELVGERGSPRHGGVRVIHSNDVWTDPMYDELFPRRLSITRCKQQTLQESKESAQRQGRIMPWIYSFVGGRFTRDAPQTAYRVAVIYCTPKLVKKAFHFVRIKEAGEPPIDFELADGGMQLFSHPDATGDGLDELLVEWHRLPTPGIFQGARSVISLAGGVWRELYRTKFEQVDCTVQQPYDTFVSLGVARSPEGTLRFREQLWKQLCDVRDLQLNIGDWFLDGEAFGDAAN